MLAITELATAASTPLAVWEELARAVVGAVTVEVAPRVTSVLLLIRESSSVTVAAEFASTVTWAPVAGAGVAVDEAVNDMAPPRMVAPAMVTAAAAPAVVVPNEAVPLWLCFAVKVIEPSAVPPLVSIAAPGCTSTVSLAISRVAPGMDTSPVTVTVSKPRAPKMANEPTGTGNDWLAIDPFVDRTTRFPATFESGAKTSPSLPSLALTTTWVTVPASVTCSSPEYEMTSPSRSSAPESGPDADATIVS